MMKCLESDRVIVAPNVKRPNVSPQDARLAELVQASRFEEAIGLLNAAICERETPERWNDWATVQHAMGNQVHAEKAYRRSLVLAPENRDAAVNLGLLLFEQGRHDEATRLLRRHLDTFSDEEKNAIAKFELQHLEARETCPAALQPDRKTHGDPDPEERIRRLEGALEYLLISNLNAKAPRTTGAASNRRLIELFLRLVQTLQPRWFLDIGANDASTACQIKAMLPACEVWAFEANPEIHARFVPAVSRAGVHYANLAISSATGKVNLYAPKTLSRAIVDGEVVHLASVEPEITGKTSLLKRNEDSTYREFSVDAITLDDFMAAKQTEGLVRDTALWIDVEGAAFEVLKGADAALKKAAVLFIEAENYEFWSGQKQAADVAKWIIAAGFIPLDRDREYGDQQFNTLFLHHTLAHLVYPGDYLLDGANAKAALPKTKKTQRTLGAHLTAQLPVFIPVFNNPTYAAHTLRQLDIIGMRNVCLVDNHSTSPAMVAFLESVEDKVSVIRTGQNKGPRQIVECPEYYDLLPDLFCITDPDLQFNPALPEDFLANLIRLTKECEIGKAGFALRIDDASLMHERTFEINCKTYHAAEWESQYWKDSLGSLRDGSPVYKADIDTTFAVYNKKFFRPDAFFKAVRVGGNYACRHLPWYRESIVGEQELSFYRETQEHALCGA